MDDNENKCPLCGKEIYDEGAFCHECREIAETSFPDELMSYWGDDKDILNESEPDNTTITTTTQRSNKKLWIFVTIGIILLIIVGAVGSYNIIQIKNFGENESAYWQQCITENTPLSYSKYLVQYPNGKFTAEAENKIRELRENERKEWEKLRNSKNIDALLTFLSNHPETPYKREIDYTIDSLSWLETIKNNTVDAYQAYLDNAKTGLYAGGYMDLAQQKYDYLSQLKTLEGDELTEIKELLTDFFNALSSTDSKNIERYTNETLSEFFEAKKQSNKVIADSIKSVIKKEKAKNITYTPNLDSLEVIQDNKDIFFTTFRVKLEKTFINRKKEKEEGNYVINIELNDQKLIQVLSTKKE